MNNVEESINEINLSNTNTHVIILLQHNCHIHYIFTRTRMFEGICHVQ
jgi:hypothetical protein